MDWSIILFSATIGVSIVCFAVLSACLWTSRNRPVIEASEPDEVTYAWFFAYCQFAELEPEDCAMVRLQGKNGCSVYKVMPIWEADKLLA